MATESETLLSRLSFGCSNLLGDKTAKQGLALLEAAYDVGIRSFDVARVYNFGDAERLVGEFARPHRHELTLTTKFGLTPNAGVVKMGRIVSIVRRIMRSSSAVRKLVRRNVNKMMQTGQFHVPSAEASLAESLRVLQTDCIDIYLMHEATSASCTDEMLAFLESAREQGKIRSFGVGSAYESIAPIARVAPRFLQVAQFESSAVHDNRRNFEAIRPAANQLVVTHGSFSGTDAIAHAISARGPQVRQWSDRVGFDLASPGNFHGALLRCALRANPGGKVIFRASTPQRIAANVAALGTAYDDAQLDAFEALCRDASMKD